MSRRLRNTRFPVAVYAGPFGPIVEGEGAIRECPQQKRGDYTRVIRRTHRQRALPRLGDYEAKWPHGIHITESHGDIQLQCSLISRKLHS